jgi:two-component system, LytTR family, sensor kinase
MTATQRKAWTWYVVIWVPVAVFYAMALTQQQSMPNVYHEPLSLASTVAAAINYVVPVAVLGVGTWRLSGILSWPPRHIERFLALQLVAALAFTALWLGAEISLLAMATSWSFAWQLSRAFRGFQAIDGVFAYGLLAGASYVIRIATRLREQEARAARADTLRMHAELSALRGQLNPHFLFNTLHTLTALVRRDPATAENALERFGDMLRYVLDVKRSAREDVTLADEMKFVRNYLSLEALRLGNRLRVVEQLDSEALDCVLPSLTLQPLVENAIKYGIAPRVQGGTVEIVAALDEQSLILVVRDDGPGARADIVDSASGVGLRAVRQRLDTRYGEASTFSVTTTPGNGFEVRLRLPAYTATGAAAEVVHA